MKWLLAFFCAAASLAAEKPNIVYIISDDQTYTDFGFMGHPLVETPNLDRLAEQSLLFENGYVPTSVCRPSLVTLLTGLYPHENGVYFNHPPPGFSKLTKSREMIKVRFDELREVAAQQIKLQPTLPRLLAKNGYRSLQTGKYWEGHFSNAGFTEGMTLAQPSSAKNGNKTLRNGDVVGHGNGDAGLAIGRETMEPIWNFIDDCKTNDDPFLLWYAPFLPHTPHDSPERFWDIYRDKKGVAEHEIPYFASISQFDETVGQVIEFVEKRGLADNTIFAFVVDNGYQPLVGKPNQHTKNSKRAPFDFGLRTPISIRWDGHVKPEKRDELVNSIDLMPTLLKMTRTPVPPSLPGLDLLSEQPNNRTIFGEVYPGDASSLRKPERDIAYRWARHGNFKLIIPHSHNGKPPWGNYLVKPALFNVADDPAETKNLISTDNGKSRAADLRAQLDAWWNPLN
jgi:uncharacterized sulfatase